MTLGSKHVLLRAASSLPGSLRLRAGYYFVFQPLWTYPDPSTKSLNSLALCLFPQKVGDLEATLVSGAEPTCWGPAVGKTTLALSWV